MDRAELPGAGDDRLDRPQVTPPPAPSDDRLIKLVVAGVVFGALSTLLLARWFKNNLVISRKG